MSGTTAWLLAEHLSWRNPPRPAGGHRRTGTILAQPRRMDPAERAEIRRAGDAHMAAFPA